MVYDEYLFEIKRKVQKRLGWYYYVGLEKISRGNGIAMNAQMSIKTVKQPSGAAAYLIAHSLSTIFLGINGAFSFVHHIDKLEVEIVLDSLEKT